MIDLGRYNTLTIARDTSVGIYLEDDEENDVLLPRKYCPEKFEIGQQLEVFVYLDHEERIIATTLTPKIGLNQFALLQVSSVEDVGAFMDWGMEKELLVPFREQRQKMQEGRYYVVYMDLDHKSNRLFASNRLDRFLQNDILTVEEKEEVNLVIMQKTDLGYTVIINHIHKGMIFQNEIFQEVHIGDVCKGYIKKIREDNKIDVSLQPIGYHNFNDINTEKIYTTLEAHNGFLPLNDKSSPEEIYETLGMSKKVFKKAIGALYKDRKIAIESNGISII